MRGARYARCKIHAREHNRFYGKRGKKVNKRYRGLAGRKQDKWGENNIPSRHTRPVMQQHQKKRGAERRGCQYYPRKIYYHRRSCDICLP